MAKDHDAAAHTATGPETPRPEARPESPAVMWLMFFAMGILPLFAFAAFDWFSVSFALSYFLPPLQAPLLHEYALTFCLGMFCWLLFFVRPVPGARNMDADLLARKRGVFSILAVPAIILSIVFSYAIAKNGFSLVETGLVSTAFWVIGLFCIQVLKYVDEFVLKNHPDCQACHSPLELALFIFAAMPGSVFAAMGFALALFV